VVDCGAPGSEFELEETLLNRLGIGGLPGGELFGSECELGVRAGVDAIGSDSITIGSEDGSGALGTLMIGREW
jgi:hypothetical protein